LTGRSDGGDDLCTSNHEGAQYSTAGISDRKSRSRTYDWYSTPTRDARMNPGGAGGLREVRSGYQGNNPPSA
jgi:hypothetical protein